MSVKSKFVLPFSVKFDSEVTGGYADTLHSEYKTSTEIVNYHKDEVKLESGYGTGITQIQSAEIELQSPFTERWVGGRSYRHVNLNTGSDNAQNRREGWHVDFQPNVIRLYSHSFLNSPPAYWTRDGRSKRPVNIANIQNEENYLGNYRENYEFLQTSGRRITNNLIVDGFVATGDLTTQFITSSLNEPYSLPDLLSQTGSRSVIVERFNAPGSKEESSRGALDREGEEMSPNIPLPFRNIKIRQPYYRQLAQHNPQFGSGSTYALLPETGSVNAVTIHKINRNRLPGTSSINDFFDNGFVTHAIPRTDIQYSWITASAITTAQQLRGYQSFRTSTYNRNLAFDDIEFISGSLVVSGSSQEFFVDNLFLNSLVKDEKTINTNTNTYSISASLSASMAEAANTPYTFTSWTSMRLGDTPVPRKLRNDNIISVIDSPNISIQKEGGNIFGFAPRRGWTTTNYEETPVTFKYLPLEHDLRFSEGGDLYQIEHEYTNTLSLFANKDLTEKLNLQTLESRNRFYDYLFIKYKDEDFRDLFYEGHNYKEIIWPREENTGLNRTRKRSAYYLDRPGFDRDGYDRQLGTQRAFWRDSQSNRKRSNLSDGGYYNSMNYLSTEETGSNFTQTEESIYTDGKFYSISSSFVTSSEINYGLYNSFSILENIGEERQYGAFIAEVALSQTSGGLPLQDLYFSMNKRLYSFDAIGEFNSTFGDSYERFRSNGDTQWSSIGSLYRNTDYKSVICQLPQDISLFEDFVAQTEDDKIKINPKLKYAAFIGGVEVNTSSYVQNKDNFDSNYFQAIGVESSVYSYLISGSDLYVAGGFDVAGGIEETNAIAKFNLDTKTWSSIGSVGNVNTIIYDMILSGNDIYIGGNFVTVPGGAADYIAKYNTETNTWSSLDEGTDEQVYSLALSGSDLYVGGDFTIVDHGGTDISAKHIAKWDTTVSTGGWSEVGDGVEGPYSTTVKAIAFSGSDMYVGGQFSTVSGSSVSAPLIAKYNTTTGIWGSLDGGLGALSDNVESIVVSGSDLYVGGTFSIVNSTPTPMYDSDYFVKWNTSTSTWGGIGSIDRVYSLALVENDIYLGGRSGLSKFDTDTETMTNSLSEASYIYSVYPDYDNKLYIGGAFTNNEETFPKSSYILVYNISDNSFENLQNISFSSNYYLQTFNQNDFSFSTMDNGLQRSTEKTSGKKPFFDSYEEFSLGLVGKTKDYSIIPEFRISDHIENYIEEEGGDFTQTNRAFLSLDGASESNFQSADTRGGNYNSTFFDTYATSDLLKKYKKIQQDNEESSELESITINVKGIKKLLPYNGFYPQDRTTQIANLYRDYVDNNLAGGIYNVSYRNDYFNNSIVYSLGGNVVSTGYKKYGDNYYLAVSYFDGGDTDDNKISIFKTNTLDVEDLNTTEIASLLPLYSNYDSTTDSWNPPLGYIFRYNFGDYLQLISASNGLNLITNASYLDSSTQTGGLLIASSSDGTNWSSLQKLEIYGSSPSRFISGSSYSGKKHFGKFYKALYDNTLSQEKIFIAITDFTYDSTPSLNMDGGVWVVTGTLENNEWKWSDKQEIYTGSVSSNRAGVGVDFISCSSGYQMFFGEIYGDNPSSDLGNVWVATSSNGETWSTPVTITSGSGDGSIGVNGIKAIDFDNKTYVFYSDPYEEVGGFTNNGGVFCVTSSTSNQWPSINSYLDKKVIYYRPENNDYALDSKISYSIEAFSGSDGRLHYFFASAGGSSADDEVAYGNKKDDIWKTTEDNNLTIVEDNNNLSVAGVVEYGIGDFEVPAFLYANSDEVRLFKNNLFTEFSINVEDSEKQWKVAAIEPILGPGILFNTVKSGLSVDWPCATGSIASITPYNTDAVTNTYYPRKYKMYEFSGSYNLQSAYGLLRSNIDYRFPFESVVFPEKGFVEKEEILQNISKRTVLQSLNEDDEFIENIKNTYIYGGYETYINNLDFSDINEFGPKRFSIPFVYKKRDSADNGLYSMAMSNFLAETVNFFLKGKDKNSKGEMVSFISKEDSQWPKFDTSKTYYMDVSINKSNDLMMMEAFHSDLHPTGSNGEKMNGRYFGYPINKTNKEIWGAEEFTEQERRTIHNDPAYAPYTPPYFEGNAKLRLSFKPTNETVTFDDLEKGVQIEAIYDGLKDAHVDSDAYINKMSLESSLNLFGKQFGTTTDSDGLETQNTNIKYWVISPKMETPVLDFSDQELLSYQNDYSKTSGFGRGMWSGYGKSPKGSSGIQLKLDFPFPDEIKKRNSLTGSLVDLLFEERGREKKIGTIASGRKISEGLVIIPYLEKSNNQTVIISNGNDQSENNKFNFIKINDEIFEEVESAYRKGDIKPKDNSIVKMIEGMEKYILPPPLDFMRDNNIPKIAMYIIDIEHVLDREDLEDIWQGLMPKISYTAQELGAGQEGDYNNHIEGINLTHRSDRVELFHGKPLDPNLRWMVFKVKQRAEKDYFKVTKDSSDDQNFTKRERKIGRQLEDYGYNWPYDYFSLLEFAKIEIRLKHKKKEE